MGIFEQYGIKEVADVTLYSIHKKEDGSGEVYYVPALYFDTLKISTVEKTAENVWAEGGLGNSRLICWDYGKRINVNLEDALCTPASLGLCWGGVLSADWKDNKVEHDYGISFNRNNVEKISRFEKSFYPYAKKEAISLRLPRLDNDSMDTVLNMSSITDGTVVRGTGYVNKRVYTWNMAIESDVKTISVVPDRFFDIYGRSYRIADKTTIAVNLAPDFKYEVIYRIEKTPIGNTSATSNTVQINGSNNLPIDVVGNNEYLKIRVDNNDKYTAYLAATPNNFVTSVEEPRIDVELFKQLDLWLKFDGINEMNYFILTKYENDICEIASSTISNGITVGNQYNVDKNSGLEAERKTGSLWAFVNPRTMEPYPDEYWLSQGEPFYTKSITFAQKGKKMKAKKITITPGQFPGMYMMVGETYIRNRDTGEDERMQIKFPLCKVKSDQTINLQADGDPTVFNLHMEVATPRTGIMAEITTYEIAKKMFTDVDGLTYELDGSTQIKYEKSNGVFATVGFGNGGNYEVADDDDVRHAMGMI